MLVGHIMLVGPQWTHRASWTSKNGHRANWVRFRTHHASWASINGVKDKMGYSTHRASWVSQNGVQDTSC